MISAFEPDEIAATAHEMFNAVGEAHNLEVDRLCEVYQLPGNRVALGSYIALRVMVARLEALVAPIIAAESRAAVEEMIRRMTTSVVASTPPPTATA